MPQVSQESPEAPEPKEPSGVTIQKLEAPLEVRALEARREITASFLAGGIFAIFALTVLFPPIYWLSFGNLPPEVLEYVKYVVPIESTLLGAIIGFYFSQKRLGGG